MGATVGQRPGLGPEADSVISAKNHSSGRIEATHGEFLKQNGLATGIHFQSKTATSRLSSHTTHITFTKIKQSKNFGFCCAALGPIQVAALHRASFSRCVAAARSGGGTLLAEIQLLASGVLECNK